MINQINFIWNNKDLHHRLPEIQGFEYLSLWQRQFNVFKFLISVFNMFPEKDISINALWKSRNLLYTIFNTSYIILRFQKFIIFLFLKNCSPSTMFILIYLIDVFSITCLMLKIRIFNKKIGFKKMKMK